MNFTPSPLSASTGALLPSNDIEIGEILAGKILVNQPTTGIYFLIRGESIVYVGQSLDVYHRISLHAKESQKAFDSYFVLPCLPSELNVLEPHYIFKFCPLYNLVLPQNHAYKSLSGLAHDLGLSVNVLRLWMRAKNIPSQDKDWHLVSDFAGIEALREWTLAKGKYSPTVADCRRFLQEVAK